MRKSNQVVTKKHVFFWNGIFSQWYPSLMVIDGVEYKTCEQYMMAMKALTFNDKKAFNEIMLTADPREQKAWGRKVRGFNTETWNSVSRDVVYKGNLAKFSQNELLKKLLLDTGDLELVEASPYDTIWGIGMGVEHSDINDPTKWCGLNWLGEVLVKVRTELNK